MKRIFIHLTRGPRQWYHEVVQAKIAPRDIALGFSVGVFISILALPLINILLVLLAIAILRVNKLATMLGYLLTPFPITPFIYYTSLRIGLFIFGDGNPLEIKEVSFQAIKQIIKTHGTNYGIMFFTGNVLLAAATATLAFLFVYGGVKIIEIIKKRKQEISPPDDKAM